MSKISVLGLVSKLRLINQLKTLNVRHVGHGSTLTNWNVRLSEQFGGCAHQHLFLQKNLQQTQQRTIHSSKRNLASDSSDDNKKKTLDEFRAEQQNIEREYDKLEKENQQTVSSETGTENKDNEDHAKIQDVRNRILDSALNHVTVHGWSIESISRGAESLNYPGVAHGMFPNGAIELIQHFYTKCNRQLVEQLKRELEPKFDSNGKPLKVDVPNPKEFAMKAIRMRLEMNIPYIDSWPMALAIMTSPPNVPTSLAQLLTLIDDICYYSGDRSIDVGWYTRRVGLASIYKVTEIYMIADKSQDYKDTWEFLKNRIDDGALIIEMLTPNIQGTKVTGAVDNVFKTARNILGINCDKR